MTSEFTEHTEHSGSSSPVGTALKYGVIGGAVLIILFLIEYISEMDAGIFRTVEIFVPIVFTVLAIREYKEKQLDGSMSYGQGFGSGVLTSFFIGLVFAIFFAIFVYLIDTEFVARRMEEFQNNMVRNNPDMTEREMETMIAAEEIMQNPIISSLAYVFTNLIIGTITALIASAFIKNR